MSEIICGYTTEPCQQCDGAGRYATDASMREWVDPCDYCHGEGIVYRPLYREEADQPTWEDLS